MPANAEAGHYKRGWCKPDRVFGWLNRGCVCKRGRRREALRQARPPRQGNEVSLASRNRFLLSATGASAKRGGAGCVLERADRQRRV